MMHDFFKRKIIYIFCILKNENIFLFCYFRKKNSVKIFSDKKISFAKKMKTSSSFIYKENQMETFPYFLFYCIFENAIKRRKIIFI